MVSEKYVKISDFGLARKPIEQSDYYRAKANTDLPIYWYSPESLETSKFSTQGDVWSYGVTVWEMFSLGGKPSQLLKDLVNSHKGSSAYRAVSNTGLLRLLDKKKWVWERVIAYDFKFTAH